MAWTIFCVMIVLLLLGFPMMIPLIVGAFVGFYWMFGGFAQLETMVQQILAGHPAGLADRGADVHLRRRHHDPRPVGGPADRHGDGLRRPRARRPCGLDRAACTMFGAVSGSTQATVVAVGSPLRPRMLKAGYKDSFVLALIVNASDIAFLIPPSIGMIIYGVVSNTSIAELFIAGIGPGLLILVLFSIYCVHLRHRNGVPTEPRPPGASGARGAGRALAAGLSRRSSSAASTAASSARPRRRRPACSTPSSWR
jgi:C4-dicarboxylate transporter, DctM subunit